MFDRWLRRPKPRVFLGSLLVVPRTDLKRHFEWSGHGKQAEDQLQSTLINLFKLPPAEERQAPLDNDLALDVAIPTSQSGSGGLMSLGDASMPLFWRPKLTICGRLRNLKNGRTLHSCSVTEKMPWREYLLGSINWRLAFGELTGASHTQMQKLLHLASIRLLQRLVKSL